jgi:endo-1,4-beta-mannosidase
MKALTVLLSDVYDLNVLFCRRQQNYFRHRKYNSAISWQPVLVVEETGVPGENHRPWASNW